MSIFFTKKQINDHFERNRLRDLGGAMDADGMLNGQGREGLRDLSFGFASVGKAGCESIGVYNALLHLGRPRPLAEIIRDMEKGGYMRLWGHLGAAPYFQPLLRRYGAASRAVLPARIQRDADLGLLEKGAVFLGCIWNDRLVPFKGLHTFAMTYDPGPGGDWVVYNRFNEDRARRRYPTLRAVLKNGAVTGAWLVLYRVLSRD